MLKLIIPILLLTGCAGTELKELPDLEGEIVEFIPSPIVPKVKMDSTNTRQKSVCLPAASRKFLKLKEKSDAGVYEYLSLTLDSLAKRTVLVLDQYSEREEWGQYFKGGIYYKHIIYLEIGIGGEIRTKCRNKSDFVRVLSPVIEQKDDRDPNTWTPGNIWDKDSTMYAPKDEDAGCYYEVKKSDRGYYYMTWYCGC